MTPLEYAVKKAERRLLFWAVLTLLLLGLGAIALFAQLSPRGGVLPTTVFEWDAVTEATDGSQVICIYELAAFWPSNNFPQFGVSTGTNTTGVLGGLVRNMIPNKPYELRVRALATNINAVSDWSSPPLMITNIPGVGPPQNLRLQ